MGKKRKRNILRVLIIKEAPSQPIPYTAILGCHTVCLDGNHKTISQSGLRDLPFRRRKGLNRVACHIAEVYSLLMITLDPESLEETIK
jgi:hypothetical protein